MTPAASLTALPPVIVVHLFAALAATLVGPFALWSRKGSPVHRTAGRTWVVLMAVTALSAVFIRATDLPHLFGFSPIHLLILSTAWGIGQGLLAIRRGDIVAHRRAMRQVYLLACLVAGAFTLLPGRFLGDLLWRQGLGLL